MLIIRKAVARDIPSIEKIINAGVEFLKEQKLPQWQDGNHPSKQTLLRDIDSGSGYVLFDESTETIVAYGALARGPETAYKKLLSGAWLKDADDYMVIHRVAVGKEYRKHGAAKRLLIGLIREGNRQGNFDTRVDTHPQNFIMQRLLKDIGFTYCGEIILPIVNGERLVYQMLNTYF